ncbi:acyl-CoA-binding protein [Schleiferia thermophila]|jgi:acyl-CoA-binding protein|uniref:acyl-CoA-binding protein n=1 Tax=Schleiferia thermophila TaxID=884107 RepID=UPI0004E6AA87|nr:acyl-CoA-binding protein [Schleiferia thermophila]KFD39798.1 hypothetical protein AT05_03040 [Schleiferia thermophila str. Yellowstone]
MYLDEIAIMPTRKALDTEFEMALHQVSSKNFPLDVYVLLMAYKNQALHGDNNSKRPERFSMVLETLIHDAWQKLKGMEASEAKVEFIKLSRKPIV